MRLWHRLCPFVVLRPPSPTLYEQRKAAWGGEPQRWKWTAPLETRKQWRKLQITKRKAG